MGKKFGRPELIVVEYWMFKLRKKVTSFCGNILPGKFDPYMGQRFSIKIVLGIGIGYIEYVTPSIPGYPSSSFFHEYDD